MKRFILYTEGVTLRAEDIMAIEVPDGVTGAGFEYLEQQLEELEPGVKDLVQVGSIGLTVNLYRIKESSLNE